MYKPRPLFMPYGFREIRMPEARCFRECLSGNPASEQILCATPSVLPLDPVAEAYRSPSLTEKKRCTKKRLRWFTSITPSCLGVG